MDELRDRSTMRPLVVVPHFMRLHEWIALEDGLYQAAGLEPVLERDIMLRSLESTEGDRGRADQPDYTDLRACTGSGCEWGIIGAAGAGKGKVLTDLYGTAPYAIFTRPDSGIRRLSQLRERPVAVMYRAGSHFTTLHALGLCVPRDQIRTQKVGGPSSRLKSLLAGEVEAATLLDPEIPVAEAMGLRTLAMGEFRTLLYVADDMPHDVIPPYIEVLRQADEALRSSPDRYLHLWSRNIRPELAGEYDYTTFGLGELLHFDGYAEETFAESVAFARRWNLAEDLASDSYDELTAPRAKA